MFLYLIKSGIDYFRFPSNVLSLIEEDEVNFSLNEFERTNVEKASVYPSQNLPALKLLCQKLQNEYYPDAKIYQLEMVETLWNEATAQNEYDV